MNLLKSIISEKANLNSIVVAAIFLIIIIIISFVPVRKTGKYAVQEGVLSVSAEENQIIPLSGEWYFINGQLTTEKDDGSQYAFLPYQWDNPTGAASYFLTLEGLTKNKEYALRLPYQSTNYRLYIDGVLAAENGNPALTKSLAEPVYKPMVITFSVQSEEAELVLQVSNFHHRRGGPIQVILLGPEKSIRKYDFWKLFADIVFSAVILILASIYMFNSVIRKEKAVLYIGLLYLFIGLMSLSETPQVLILRIFPEMSWSFFQKWCYITAHAIPVASLLSAYRLFGGIHGKCLKIFLIPFAVLFVIVLASDPLIFTRLNFVFEGAAFLVYTLIFFICIRAVLHSYPYAIPIFIAYLILFCSALSGVLFAGRRINATPYLPLSFVNLFSGSVDNSGFPLDVLSYILLVVVLNIFSLVLNLKNPQITARKKTTENYSDIKNICATAGLSLRETDVVLLILEGKNNKEICSKLYISMSTVKTHISRILKKTNVTNRIDLFFYFYKNHTNDRH